MKTKTNSGNSELGERRHRVSGERSEPRSEGEGLTAGEGETKGRRRRVTAGGARQD